MGLQGSPGMCPERHGGDRRGQGPLLLSVGVAPSPDIITGAAPTEARGRKTGRGRRTRNLPGQVLNQSTYDHRCASHTPLWVTLELRGANVPALADTVAQLSCIRSDVAK